jgi:small subunit ribosomal protein S6
METVKGIYEMVIIMKADLGEEATTTLADKFKNLIIANGTLDAVDDWGKRRLAYPIDDDADGYYIQLNFTSEKSFPAELDRQLKITDGIMRSLIICKDK